MKIHAIRAVNLLGSNTGFVGSAAAQMAIDKEGLL
jgi:hypothetical protein